MAVEITLNTPVLLHSKDEGALKEYTVVTLNFKGKRGLKHIKSLQDCIYSIIFALGKNKTGEDNAGEDTTVMSSELLLTAIEVSGKSAHVFEAICGKLESIATINGLPLTNTIQDTIEMNDFDKICNGVLTNFLLPSVIQKLNSMNS